MAQAARRPDNRYNLAQRRNRLRRQMKDMDLRQRALTEMMKVLAEELREIEDELEQDIDE